MNVRRSMSCAALVAAISGTAIAQVADSRLQAAQRIDRLIEEALEQHGERPADIVDDATFLRRAYLNIAGRIPNLQETEEFLQARDTGKRAKLIENLLASPGYASHMFNFWADLLRAKTQLAQQTSGEPYLKYLTEVAEQNRPFDEFVRELLTASGPAHARDNGATGYLMRDRGMPEDNMANTVRVFLGTRLECAQCHDHPTDKWTQRQFYEMAAFTGGIQYRQDMRNSEAGKQIRAMASSVRETHGEAGQRTFRRMLRNVSTGINGTGTGVIALPKDYQYDDALPGQAVVAKTMFGDAVELDVKFKGPKPRRKRAQRSRLRPVRAPEIDSRSAYAAWLTSPDNPRFTTVIANRMWKRVMGRGLIEPVDDMKDDTVASNPRLMAYLEDLMRELRYDLRAFQHVLWSTQTFQRAVPSREPAADATYLFAGPLLRRMTAEQLWDSMLTFVVHDVDTTLGIAKNERAEQTFARYEQFFELEGQRLDERIELGNLRQTNPDEFRRRVREIRQRERTGEQDSFRQARKRAMPLIRQIQRARREGEFAKEDELIQQLDEMGLLHALRRANRQVVRASELASPAPAGHFLREFGQSDREEIEGSDSNATVPQVLSLVNGFIERNVLRKNDSPLMLGIHRAKSAEARIRASFLSVLNREPSRAEIALWRADIGKGNNMAGCRDLVWALVNSHEFRFQL